MTREEIVRLYIHLRQLQLQCEVLSKAIEGAMPKVQESSDPQPRSHEDCSELATALSAAIAVAAAALAAKNAAIQVSETADAAVYAVGQLWFNCEFHEG